MKLPEIKQLEDPSALIAAIGDYVDEAQRLVEAQETVALSGLDSVVEALCTRVEAMPLQEGKRYAAEFEKLMTRLEALQESMRTAQENVAKALKKVGVQRKANRAYAASKVKNKDQ